MKYLICPECNTKNLPGRTHCLGCGRLLEDVVANEPPVPVSPSVPVSPVLPALKCLRCGNDLRYVGKKRFHEGVNWAILGELGEMFVNKQHLDMYVCLNCGHVKFFADDIGRHLRPMEE